MLPIYSGSDETRRAAEAYQLTEISLLRRGGWQKLIPLNGGSDTRKAAREYWREWAALTNIEYMGCGCMVILGSPRPTRHRTEGGE